MRIKFEPKRFGGFEVDHEVKFCRPYDRQFARLLALENPPSVDASLADRVNPITGIASCCARAASGHAAAAPPSSV